MKEPKRYPLTGSDREKYIERIRKSDGYVTHRVHKARFGPNDIFGCIDIISYDPWGLLMDQVSTVHHISDKVKEIERMLKVPPENTLNHIKVHGIDGYATGKGKARKIHVTRYVVLEWLEDGTWEREEIAIRTSSDPSNLNVRYGEGNLTLPDVAITKIKPKTKRRVAQP